MPDILKCKIEDCHVLKHEVASPGVSEGDMGLLEDTVYAWLEDYETGAIGVKVIEAERIVLPATSASTFSVGNYVYYIAATANLTNTNTGTYRCGICRKAKAALELTVEVDFWGNRAIAT
jgi:predicted RecA/RadA family phage recombinase